MEDSLEKINDEEVSLPKATIDKIISESLLGKPVTKELKEVVLQSAIEFIHLITSEANELCEKEHKKTITHDHVYKSLENLGYTHFIKPCKEVYTEHVNLAKMKPSKTNKLKNNALTIEELYEEQTKLIAIAKVEAEKIAKLNEVEKNNIQEIDNVEEASNKCTVNNTNDDENSNEINKTITVNSQEEIKSSAVDENDDKTNDK
ncbi:negative cofactor 2 transcription regulator complex subunit ncb2 [Binucleata daphniae]